MWHNSITANSIATDQTAQARRMIYDLCFLHATKTFNKCEYDACNFLFAVNDVHVTHLNPMICFQPLSIGQVYFCFKGYWVLF